MARNKLSDLNNHLYAQLERLEDESLTPEQIKAEVSRAGAISRISSQIVANARVNLEAVKYISEGKIRHADLPKNLLE